MIHKSSQTLEKDARCNVTLDNYHYSYFNFSFSEINEVIRVDQEPYNECEYYKLDYSACDDIWDKNEVLACINGINKVGLFKYKDQKLYQNLWKTKTETATCEAKDAIFDTSLFKSTVPSEFGLACEKSTLNSLATSLSFIGLFFGAFSAGYFSDNYGRKVTIVVAIFLNGLFWVLQAWIPGYWAFVILRILVQGSNQAAYLTYNCYGKFFTVFGDFKYLRKKLHPNFNLFV